MRSYLGRVKCYSQGPLLPPRKEGRATVGHPGLLGGVAGKTRGHLHCSGWLVWHLFGAVLPAAMQLEDLGGSSCRSISGGCSSGKLQHSSRTFQLCGQ